MDPAKTVRVETRVQSQVRGWLQYGEELGLGPYYRDRSAVKSGVTAEIEEIRFGSQPASEPTEEKKLMPPTKILKSAAATLISPAHAETLFGDPYRVANDSL